VPERGGAHVAGQHAGLVRERVEQGRDRAHEGRHVAAREVGAPDRAAEQDVAAEQRLLVRDGVGDVARGVAGREQDVDLAAGERQRLAAADGLLGVVGLVGPEAGERVAVDVLEHRDLGLRAVDRRAGGAGERRDRADVVEVRVREEDRLDRGPELLEHGLDALGLVAGVDHERAGGAVAASDPAVLLDRPDGEAPDVHHFRFCARLYTQRSVA
jgi:hypothetical protein